MREIPGDPLTGQLPATRLVISPLRTAVKLDVWPLKPDLDPVNLRLLKPGNVAYVRTRWGIKERMIRTVNVSRHWRGKGRRFFVGMNRRGTCRPYWASQIISIEGRGR